MLYILNKASGDSLRQLQGIAGGDDEASVLLISDAVFLSTTANLKKFEAAGVESFYASGEDAARRKVEPDDEVELLDYKEMAALIEDFDRIVTL